MISNPQVFKNTGAGPDQHAIAQDDATAEVRSRIDQAASSDLGLMSHGRSEIALAEIRILNILGENGPDPDDYALAELRGFSHIGRRMNQDRPFDPGVRLLQPPADRNLALRLAYSHGQESTELRSSQSNPPSTGLS